MWSEDILRILLVSAILCCALSVRSNEYIAERLAARGDLSRDRRQLPTEIQIQVTAPLFSSRLFNYGPEEGDIEIPRQVDVGKRVTLSYPLGFYGEQFDTVYILSNGAIGFDSSSRTYKPNILPAGPKLLSPFWNRNDLRKGGHVYYREITDGRILERGASEIRYQYDKDVKVRSCLMVTWVGMQPLGNTVLPEENTNTFQAAIFISENGTFANLIYSNIGWTQGAEAGFNEGNDRGHFALPTSGTGNIMYLEDYGNTGIPGEWMFQTDMDMLVSCKPGIKGDTCDEACDGHEWGYDCANCCHCAAGKCDAINGQCASTECAECWTGPPFCQDRVENCRVRGEGCVHNAISFTEYDRCGEPIQRCQCLNGYEGNGHELCTDIDECERPDSCHPNALCTNTPGSFFCQCPEGFAGDGVTECKASFLYPTENHQVLPKTKHSKVAWQLRQHMQIFGQKRNRLTITSNGIIGVDDIPSQYSSGENLDSLGVLGFAPFFGRINLLRGGQVLVEETTDSDVLTRATNTINDHFTQPGFVAQSVLTITYVNVSNDFNMPGNTFQANIIGGKNVAREPVTYVEFLYQDLHWSEGAEASIMSEQSDNSVVLPGSGTEGVRQLTELSNIGRPGQWVFRVDESRVYPCPEINLQPPYCDEEAPIIPTFATEPTTRPTTTTTTTTTTRTTPTTRATTRAPTTRRQTARPTEPERVTFPPFKTIIPQFFTPVIVGGQTAPATNGGRPGIIINRPVQTRPQTTTRPTTRARLTPPPGLQPAQSRETTIRTRLPFVTAAPITQHIPDIPSPPPDTFPPINTGTAAPFVTAATTTTSTRTTGRPSPFVPLETLAPSPDRTQPPLFTVIQQQNTPAPPPTVANTDAQTTTDAPFFLFTTARRTTRLPVPTRPQPPIVTARTEPTNIYNRPTSRPTGRFNTRNTKTADTDSSKLAIIIPTAIVGVWLLLLLVIGLVVCCKRRRSRKRLRSKYDPGYHFRHMPVGHPGVRPQKEGRGYPQVHGSYEDHLEKAARLSSEMSQYNQNGGRLSLYGSYWNLGLQSNSSGGRNGSSSSSYYNNQGYYDSCPEFQRYGFQGRY